MSIRSTLIALADRVSVSASSALETLQSFPGAGYDAGGTTTRGDRRWLAPHGTADELTLDDLWTLRDRSRDLYRNSAIGRSIASNLDENVIGSGLSLQSTIDADVLGLPQDQVEQIQDEIERRFAVWARSQECDAARKENFFGLQSMAFLNQRIDGESFAIPMRFRRRRHDPTEHPLKIMLLGAHRCESPHSANSERMREGIEVNSRGEPVSYTFSKREGYLTYPRGWVRVPAFGRRSGRKNVLHMYRQEFIGQTRGVPFISSIMNEIKSLDRYSKHELANAAVSSLFSVFIKSNRSDALDSPLDGETRESSDDLDYTLEPGAVHRLDVGEDIEFANPQRPATAFETFINTHLMLIAMATSLPHEILVKQFHASFSASKAARVEAWRYYQIERNRFVRQFCTPVFREWFVTELAMGSFSFSAPGFFDDPMVREAWIGHSWFGEGAGQIDPVRETTAALRRVEGGLSTATQESAALGNDFEKNISIQRRERRLMRELREIGGEDEGGEQ